MSTGIYSITNTLNGMQYIGSAVNMPRRWAGHVGTLDAHTHRNAKLQNAWNKYGADKFTFKVLLLCAREDLIFYEQRAMDGYNVVKNGYNICPNAASPMGTVRSIESRAKMSAAATGRKQSPEMIAKRVTTNTGKTRSQKFREHMSIVATGRIMSPESIKKVRAANTGRSLSSEHRAKLSVANKGYIKSHEHIEKISASRKASRIAKK